MDQVGCGVEIAVWCGGNQHGTMVAMENQHGSMCVAPVVGFDGGSISGFFFFFFFWVCWYMWGVLVWFDLMV